LKKWQISAYFVKNSVSYNKKYSVVVKSALLGVYRVKDIYPCQISFIWILSKR